MARGRVCSCSRTAMRRGRAAHGSWRSPAATADIDAFHITAPPATAKGRPPRSAVRSRTPSSHPTTSSTSTPRYLDTDHDRAETAALKTALGERAKTIPISSTKSAIGHLLGAAGAVEAVATILALRARVLPPTLGLEEPDPELDLDYIPDIARTLDSTAGGPSRFPTHSASAVTTPCCAWRRHDDGTCRAGPEAKLSRSSGSRFSAIPIRLHLLRTDVRSRRMATRRVRGWSVGATGRVDGRPVACFAQDASFAGGSLGEAHATPSCRSWRWPSGRWSVIGFVESAGARMQEGSPRSPATGGSSTTTLRCSVACLRSR